MCTFRAGCYSKCLSWVLVLTWVSPFVQDKMVGFELGREQVILLRLHWRSTTAQYNCDSESFADYKSEAYEMFGIQYLMIKSMCCSEVVKQNKLLVFVLNFQQALEVNSTCKLYNSQLFSNTNRNWLFYYLLGWELVNRGKQCSHGKLDSTFTNRWSGFYCYVYLVLPRTSVA